VVTALCFEKMYHEIFNEPHNEAVFDTLRRWLDAHYRTAVAQAA
jgi:alpha-beta hydrolase superfamily lysophospholipase